MLLYLGWDILLAAIHEGGFLFLETLEMLADQLFEIIGLGADAAQVATAWSAMLIFLALLGWLIYWLRKRYLKAKEVTGDWWLRKMDVMVTQWKELNRTHKLVRIIGLLLALFLLINLIF